VTEVDSRDFHVTFLMSFVHFFPHFHACKHNSSSWTHSPLTHADCSRHPQLGEKPTTAIYIYIYEFFLSLSLSLSLSFLFTKLIKQDAQHDELSLHPRHSRHCRRGIEAGWDQLRWWLWKKKKGKWQNCYVFHPRGAHLLSSSQSRKYLSVRCRRLDLADFCGTSSAHKLLIPVQPLGNIWALGCICFSVVLY
jgi:hypothetical protein